MSSHLRRVTAKPVSVDLAERLHRAAILLLRRVRVADLETGLSGPKLSALSVLHFGGPMRLTDLAAAEQVRAPTMSKLVAELEEEGLAVKRADADDKRSARIEVTAKGRALMEEGRKRRLALLRTQLGRFSASELATLDAASKLLLRAPKAES
ncbi:MarR family winged helix-turn-helix transcriptional regulator [Terricaulis sp.]|uniref:MarR family winged helix-turn-helix transcriptional regulator n=1 Tax=Terricaulis sp. TaxID=2768686 RepID=UPI003783B303